MSMPEKTTAIPQKTNPSQISELPAVFVDSSMISDPSLLEVAAKLAAKERLDASDGMALMTTGDLLGLGAMADAVRRVLRGKKAYYVLNRHINYSNVCVNHCVFCAYWRAPKQDGAFCLSPEDAAQKAAEEPGLDISELHVVGGCHPDLSFEYYLELLRALKKARPKATLKAFTAVEIAHFAEISGKSPEQVLLELKRAGLGSMPGGGAEIFAPRVRRELCPRKADAKTWLKVAGMAHNLAIPTNATMLYGHIETPEERVDHILRLREQQDISGGFTAFIPLAFHPGNTGLKASSWGTTGMDDLRVIAASRLLLDNIPHIKAYWVMLGPKLAQVALNFGADDLDGTIVEERITHMAGAQTAVGLTEEALRGMIKAGGFEPVRRDSFYNSLEDVK
jgi:aminodeoxyfutalosine synthase